MRGKKEKFFWTIVAIFFIILIFAFRCISIYNSTSNNASWKSLKNIKDNVYLKSYGFTVDKQYKEYEIKTDGRKIYNYTSYSADDTNLLLGSSYNNQIMYATVNVISNDFFIKKMEK